MTGLVSQQLDVEDLVVAEDVMRCLDACRRRKPPAIRGCNLDCTSSHAAQGSADGGHDVLDVVHLHDQWR
jgi:hypothetical protein